MSFLYQSAVVTLLTIILGSASVGQIQSVVDNQQNSEATQMSLSDQAVEDTYTLEADRLIANQPSYMMAELPIRMSSATMDLNTPQVSVRMLDRDALTLPGVTVFEVKNEGEETAENLTIELSVGYPAEIKTVVPRSTVFASRTARISIDSLPHGATKLIKIATETESSETPTFTAKVLFESVRTFRSDDAMPNAVEEKIVKTKPERAPAESVSQAVESSTSESEQVAEEARDNPEQPIKQDAPSGGDDAASESAASTNSNPKFVPESIEFDTIPRSESQTTPATPDSTDDSKGRTSEFEPGANSSTTPLPSTEEASGDSEWERKPVQPEPVPARKLVLAPHEILESPPKPELPPIVKADNPTENPLVPQFNDENTTRFNVNDEASNELSNQIQVSVEGSDSVITGKRYTYIVSIQNPTEYAIENLKIGLAEGSKFTIADELNEAVYLEKLDPYLSVKYSFEVFTEETGKLDLSFRATGDFKPENGQVNVASLALQPLGPQLDFTTLHHVMATQPQATVTLVGPTTMHHSTQADFSIVCENSSQRDLKNVSIHSAIPAGLEITILDREAQMDVEKGFFGWQIPTIKAGQQETIRFRVRAVQQGTQLTSLDMFVGETHFDRATITTDVAGPPNLKVVIHDDAKIHDVGDDSRLIIRVDNLNDHVEKHLTVAVRLPEGVTVSRMGTYRVLEDNHVVFPAITLEKGEGRKFVLEVRASEAGKKLVKATVTSEKTGVSVTSEDEVVFRSVRVASQPLRKSYLKLD